MDSSRKYFLKENTPHLDQRKVDSIVKHALFEDIGKGDITTQLTIPPSKHIDAILIAKENGIMCGLDVAESVFKTVDKGTEFTALAKEGAKIKKGKTIVTLSGKAQSILSAERVALNFLSMLSGIATKAREYVEKVKPYKVKITDTRKTMPGLRELQKYAVRTGGGFNHRMALDEMILLKDNHLQIMAGYSQLPKVPKGYEIEIEVQNLEEFIHALKFKPNVIMLDNMSVSDMQKAVKIRNATTFTNHHPKTLIETSGGVTIESVRKIAATGVDIISIGELTHTINSLDISLDVV